MTQDMIEKMMNRVAKAEKGKEESEKIIRMISYLSKNTFIEKNNIFYDESNKKIKKGSNYYNSKNISDIILKAIFSGEKVEEVNVEIQCIKYKQWILYYNNNSVIYYNSKLLPKYKE